MKEGRKDGLKEGRKDGLKEGRNERRMDGWKERKEGKVEDWMTVIDGLLDR